ncbi:MAG TPA: Hsp20/alpha crystallin family protein [Candidatus Thermoplasmatota archaeon]|nr:Hsp20/alpha crystallin family protein [Candidatus Thermoplasmatota archaeon]
MMADIHAPAAQPDVELLDEPTAYVLLIDLPHASPEDLEVLVTAHSVSVKAHPRMRSARQTFASGYAPFDLKRELPAEVDVMMSEARLNGPVLQIYLPKLVSDVDPTLRDLAGGGA